MISKIKSATCTVLAVISVLFSAYNMGGRSARKSVEIKRRQEDNRRLQTTLDVKNEVQDEVQQKESGVAANELRNDWMRK
ncbi:hypothetical protein KKJ09_13305 [Xenorhabdus bovienii]|uniref:hypothetical protein n=2 Tax=Xenorhabdus bovienii TaxID=40576 RepID=UPI003DA54F19|nr:hypothetical protein [Xenorhabdus bovienii]MDE9502933.1 hypothetical protein [Xenorhabdus bovienii]MDE9526583.1 hypothetical protein [Xenorhabdus bovienii]